MKKYFYLFGLMTDLAANGLAATIYVDATATGAIDGNSWINAYTTLTAALIEANANTASDSILIAAGTYRPGNL